LLAGRVALVTGGARGIGSAICERLAREGASVALHYRSSADEAERTLSAIRGHGVAGVAIAGDLSAEGEVDRVLGAATEALGPVTLLVNNAAYTRLLEPAELTMQRWRRFMSTNLDAPFEMMWAAKDGMIAAGGGAIVNISSTAGVTADPRMIGYGASKAALNHLTQTAAVAFADKGIRVNAVAPGLILTERSETVPPELRARMAEGVPMKRGGQPEEIASVVGFLLSDEASYLTGQVVVVAGGR